MLNLVHPLPSHAKATGQAWGFLSSSTAIAQATKPLESSGRGQPKIRTPDPHIFWVGDPMEFEFYIAFVTTCWDLPLEFGEVRRKNGVVQRSMGYTSNKWGRKEGRKEARKEGSRIPFTFVLSIIYISGTSSLAEPLIHTHTKILPNPPATCIQCPHWASKVQSLWHLQDKHMWNFCSHTIRHTCEVCLTLAPLRWTHKSFPKALECFSEPKKSSTKRTCP